MRIACLSDIHGHFVGIPDCDLLLLGGDYCPGTKGQNWWLRDEFLPWLCSIAARGIKIIGVAGNHDLIFESKPELVPSLPWTYLQDSGCEFRGLKIWGSPWQPRYYDWAFNADEPELYQKWQQIPNDTDILLLHGPPYLVCDATSRRDRIGSISLRARIEQVQPRLVVCGHNHAGYGQARLGNSLVVNASLVNENYRPVNPVQVIEMDITPLRKDSDCEDQICQGK